jgi:hypothetical protein
MQIVLQKRLGLHAYRIQLRLETKGTYPPKRVEYVALMVPDIHED